MKSENSSNNKEKLTVIAAVSAIVVAIAVIVVIFFSDRNVSEVNNDGEESSAPIVSSDTVADTEDVSKTEISETTFYVTSDNTENDLFSEVNETVTAKELTNLRRRPSSDSDIAETLKNGEIAVRTGVGNTGWSRLEYNGQTLYAISSYLTTDLNYQPIDIPKADIVEGNTFTSHSDSVTAKELTNLRSLPTTESDIIGTLVSGEFIERTAISDKGWSRLVYNGQTVYAVTNYLSNEVVPPYVAPDGFEETDEYVTAKDETNLRTAPSVDNSEVVHTLVKGEYLRRVAVNTASGWSRLEYNGQTVYAVSSYLELQHD